MKAQINGFIACKDANIEIDNIAVVAGHNEAGKTSIVRAFQAIMTGDATATVEKLKKKDIKELINDSGKMASIDFSDGDNHAYFELPSGKVKAEGILPKTSKISLGIDRIFDMDEKEKRKIFFEMFDAEPSFGDISDYLKALNFDEKKLQAIHKMIERDGWDSQHSKQKEEGAYLKGAWRQVTGENYRKDKASGWFPENYVDGSDVNALEKEINELKAKLKDTIQTEAVAGNKIEQMKSQVKDEKKLQTRYEKFEKDHDAAADEMQKHEELQEKYRSLKVQKCPVCDHPLVVVDGVINDASDINESDQIDLATYQKSLALYRKAIAAESTTRLEMDKLRNEIFAIDKSKKALKEIKSTVTKAKPENDTENIETQISEKQNIIQAVKAKKDADDINFKIFDQVYLVEMLSPDGLRLKKLMKYVNAFNTEIAKLSKIFNWKGYWLDKNLEPYTTTENKPYILMSNSAKFRVNILFQIYHSIHMKEEFLIIDNAEILDKAGRVGLLKTLNHVKAKSLVVMTMLKKEDLPPSGKILKTYWIENGKVA